MTPGATATWIRLSIVCAAVAGLAFGTAIWLARSPQVRTFAWGGAPMGPNAPVENAIHVFEPFDPGAGTLGYYTGGRSGGTDEARPAPARVIAESAIGAVVVRLRAFDGMERPDARDEASAVARVVSAVTTGVWPGEPTPVEIDVHLMPDDAPFSLARQVRWRTGEPLVIATFARAGWDFEPGTPAHELYHVLAARWSLGASTVEEPSGGGIARALEQIAADLFAACGKLLALGSLERPAGGNRIVIQRPDPAGPLSFVNPVAGDGLAVLLDLAAREGMANPVGQILAESLLHDVFADGPVMARTSPEGERLVSICRESLPVPARIATRLDEIARR